METHWIDIDRKKWRIAKSGRLNFWNAGAVALRRHVFIRDAFKCVKCGWCPSLSAALKEMPTLYSGQYTLTQDEVGGKRKELQLDHIVPISKGGSNHPENMQTLCFSCNASKRDR